MVHETAIHTPDATTTDTGSQRHEFDLTWKSARTPLLFLLCMSGIGLYFYPAFLVMFALMVKAWRSDRYNFLIMVVLAYGGFQFYPGPTLSRAVFMLPVAIIGLFIVKKSPMVRKGVLAECFYLAVIMIVAWKSLEPLSHQLPVMTTYMTFMFFVIPLIIFNGRKFCFDEFFRRLYPYCIIICIFYVIDYFILCGYVLIPSGDNTSSFWDPDMVPLTFYFRRMRPPGLYLLVMLIYPLAHQWKLRWWNWIFIIGALAATQTFTVLTGLIFGFVIAQGSLKKYGKYIVSGLLFFAALYCVDAWISGGSESSVLRVRSQVDQIVGIKTIQDEEDLAEMGTGRMAQALPKLVLIDELDMQTFGFGFLHPELTTNEIFYVDNPFYTDISKSHEIATGVEISSVQLFLNMGWFGLVCHVIWLVWLWWIVRRQPMGKYFLTVMVVFLWFGIGGYSGMNQQVGQLLAAVAFAGVILSDTERAANKLPEGPAAYSGKSL